MSIRARIGTAVMAVAATATLLVTTGTANAHDRSGHSHAHGSTPIADFDWHVSRDSHGRAHGYFKGKAPDGAALLISLEGPATCVDIEGNKVGFLYPVEDHSRPFLLKGQSILITGVDNGGHGRDKMGFSPIGFFHDCHPSIAPFPVTSGHIEVDHH
jgi:hypothetical protein